MVRERNVSVDRGYGRNSRISSVYGIAMPMRGRSASNCCSHVGGLRCMRRRRRFGGGRERGSALGRQIRTGRKV